MLKVLVTGGAGFIGTHLCRALSAQGHPVSVLDLRDPDEVVENVSYIRGNVCDAQVLRSCGSDIDCIFHLAAMVSVPMCQENPAESYEVNLLGTVRVIEQALANQRRTGKPTRVVFSSSSAVYGNQAGSGDRIKESEPPCPRSFYALQKLASENAIRLACEVESLRAVVFRFFNVFGPGQKADSPYSGVISLFIRAIQEGRALRLNGGGAQTRDFVSVKDIVNALTAAMVAPESVCDGRPVNLGTGKSVSIRDLAERLKALGSQATELVDAPHRAGDVMHSCADIARAWEVLKWKPVTSLDHGLSELMSKGGVSPEA